MNDFKFADMLTRVDCYHGMFINQTEMLMCGQLLNLENEFEKIKVYCAVNLMYMSCYIDCFSYLNHYKQ